MYTEFFNLKEKPFNLTPSPRFLYLGEVHKEALALLTYGVVERKGFILLTGEIGTGKTTLIQALLANLDEDIQCVHISNPLLSPEDFITYLAFSVFKKKVHFRSKADFLIEFEEFLRDCLREQKTFVLIIDEAQKLSFDLLEEIRLLSNMETADEKLINIFLVGQPELNEKLRDPQCKPLLQRISTRYHIEPLDLGAVQEYVLTRLKIAGAKDERKIFPKSAIKAIHQYSGGYPRMVNILADNALLLGYARGKAKISPEMVKECYGDMQLEGPQSKGKPSQEGPVATVRGKPRPATRMWKWAAVLVIFLSAVFLLSDRGKDLLGHLADAISVYRIPDTKEAAVEKGPLVNGRIPRTDREIQPVADETLEAAVRMDEKGVDRSEGEALAVLTPSEELPDTEEIPTSNEDKSGWKTVIVKEGDTITGLAVNTYGSVDQMILDMVRRHNPDIEDLNRITVGEEIVFPPLSASEHGPTYTVHISSFSQFSRAREVFQTLLAKGYEPYIMPASDREKGRVFRVTLGNFEERREAEQYASKVLDEGLSEYAKPICLEIR